MVVGSGGTLLYNVTDPLHPRAVCRITNSSAHVVTGSSFEYLVPAANGTTKIVRHSLGSNNETVVATLPVDLSGDYIGSPWSPVSWLAGQALIAYVANGGQDANGFSVTDVWLATTTKASKVFSYSVPGVDSFGRPGLPPLTLALSPDGAYLVAGWPINNTLHVFRVSDLADVSPAMPGGVRLGVWSRAGHTLYLVGSAGVEGWSPESRAAMVPGTLPWTLGPSFAPDDSQVAFTVVTPTHDVRTYAYDFKSKSQLMLVDQPRSSAVFVAPGWVWYLEEKPCVALNDNACFDPTTPDGNVLALNLTDGQESPVSFAPGESPFGQQNWFYLSGQDVWPHA